MKFPCDRVLIYYSSIKISQNSKYNLSIVKFKYSTYPYLLYVPNCKANIIFFIE